MVTTAASVEWTVVATDVDSLQLEYMWIKEFDPPFNVRYKDDKSYPFMAITLADEAPRVIVTRNRRIPGAKYFGPYPKVWAVHDTIDLMIKVFPIRTCSDASYKKAMADRPPLLPRADRALRRAVLDEGHDRGAPRDRRRLRRLHVGRRPALHERADGPDARGLRGDGLRIRRGVPRPPAAIDAVLDKSALVLAPDADADLFGIAEDELAATVQHFVIRGGRVRGVRATTIEKEIDISDGDLVDQVLQRTYGDAAGTDIPRRYWCPRCPTTPPSSRSGCATAAGQARDDPGRAAGPEGRSHAHGDPQRAAGADAAQDAAHQRLRRPHQALTDLQEALDLAEAPLRIECFDVSHLSGTNVVASMVVFEDGLPRKDQYRSFGVPETTDDTDSMYQVLTRRLAYLDRPEERTSPMPDVTSDETVVTTGSARASPTARSCWSSTAASRRSRRRHAPSATPVMRRSPSAASPSASRRCGCRGRSTRSSCRGRARRSICCSGCATRRTASRSRTSAGGAAATSRASSPRSPGSAKPASRRCCGTSAPSPRCKAATPEEIAQLPGVGPKLAASIHTHLSTGRPTPAPTG